MALQGRALNGISLEIEKLNIVHISKSPRVEWSAIYRIHENFFVAAVRDD